MRRAERHMARIAGPLSYSDGEVLPPISQWAFRKGRQRQAATNYATLLERVSANEELFRRLEVRVRLIEQHKVATDCASLELPADSPVGINAAPPGLAIGAHEVDHEHMATGKEEFRRRSPAKDSATCGRGNVIRPVPRPEVFCLSDAVSEDEAGSGEGGFSTGAVGEPDSERSPEKAPTSSECRASVCASPPPPACLAPARPRHRRLKRAEVLQSAAEARPTARVDNGSIKCEKALFPEQAYHENAEPLVQVKWADITSSGSSIEVASSGTFKKQPITSCFKNKNKMNQNAKVAGARARDWLNVAMAPASDELRDAPEAGDATPDASSASSSSSDSDVGASVDFAAHELFRDESLEMMLGAWDKLRAGVMRHAVFSSWKRLLSKELKISITLGSIYTSRPAFRVEVSRDQQRGAIASRLGKGFAKVLAGDFVEAEQLQALTLLAGDDGFVHSVEEILLLCSSGRLHITVCDGLADSEHAASEELCAHARRFLQKM